MVDNLGKNVDEWFDSGANGGNGGSHWDVCKPCWKLLERDPHMFDDELQPYNDTPDGIDHDADADHVPYAVTEQIGM